MRRFTTVVVVVALTLLTAGFTTGCTPPTLRAGDRGPDVLAMQQSLNAQGYWLGALDGVYGPNTSHAVMALQKAHGIARTGEFNPETRAALDRNIRPHPHSRSGHVVEVDLNRQIVLVADNGWTSWIFNTSTGLVPGSTPAGWHRVYRQVNGNDYGPYGSLYRPKYFIRGVAVHGSPSVVAWPASHGCVRVTNATMDFLWATNALPIGGAVWVY
jgi:hypothetical protein